MEISTNNRKKRAQANEISESTSFSQPDICAVLANSVQEGNKKEPRSNLASKASEKELQFSYRTYVICLIAVTILSFATRWWDEAHFGKFGGHYINRTYYTDVHPPLAKMLVGLALKLAKFDGEFQFDSGKPFPENFDYGSTRRFLSAMGALAIPFLFSTAYNMGLSAYSCLLVAVFSIFENGFIVISKPILLDSSLLLFTSTTINFLVKFNNQASHPFGIKWWLYLTLTGFSIGVVASCKWVGLFSMALVGLFTVWSLWNIWCNRSVSIKTFAGHFLARALCLILIPFAVYAFSFYVHFKILNRSGPGDAQMSSLFQASLKDSKIAKSPLSVVYGASVCIKNKSYYGGLLHSHVQRLPEGSGNQQVTTYHHSDHNNHWIFKMAKGQFFPFDANDMLAVKNGDIIRLQHASTTANLRASKIEAFVTKGDFEVSGYGNDEVHDKNDLWKIEFVGKDRKPSIPGLKTFFTSFRLKNVALNCYLRYTGQSFPEWGFRQGEITCTRDLNFTKDTCWNIEENINSFMPVSNENTYSTNFWEDFIDLNFTMMRSNNSLVTDPEVLPAALTSTPTEWPLLKKGIRMASWDDNASKFYMLANPIVGWISFASILVTFAIFAYGFMSKSRYGTTKPENRDSFYYKTCVSIGGWFLHFFPFYIMGRVLYFHHYYPGLLFAILNTGTLFDFLTRNQSKRTKLILATSIAAASTACFFHFAPMCYGIEGPIDKFRQGRQWLSSWL